MIRRPSRSTLFPYTLLCRFSIFIHLSLALCSDGPGFCSLFSFILYILGIFFNIFNIHLFLDRYLWHLFLGFGGFGIGSYFLQQFLLEGSLFIFNRFLF